jgi:hypothetical protein
MPDDSTYLYPPTAAPTQQNDSANTSVERPLGVTLLAILYGLAGAAAFLAFVFIGIGVFLSVFTGNYIGINGQANILTEIIAFIIILLVFLIAVVLPFYVSYGFWYGIKTAWWIAIIFTGLATLLSLLSLILLNLTAIVSIIVGVLIIYYLNNEGVTAFFDSYNKPLPPELIKKKTFLIAVVIVILVIVGLITYLSFNTNNSTGSNGIPVGGTIGSGIPNNNSVQPITTTTPVYKYEITPGQVYEILGRNYTISSAYEDLNASTLEYYGTNTTTGALINTSVKDYGYGSVTISGTNSSITVNWYKLANVSAAKQYIKYPNLHGSLNSTGIGTGRYGNASYAYYPSNYSNMCGCYTNYNITSYLVSYDGSYAIAIIPAMANGLPLNEAQTLLETQLQDLGLS